MVKRSYKKIIGYVLVWVMFIFMIFAGLFLIRLEEKKNNAAWMQELKIMHPEQEDELKESEIFYRGHTDQIYLEVFVGCAVLSALLLAVFYYFSTKKETVESKKIDERLLYLLEKMEQFQKGEFHVDSSKFELEKYSGEQEKWTRIFDQLKDLGYYFEDLKDKLNEEENSTKTLISDISHQLKTPLASLRMSHELVLGEGLTEQEKEEFQKKEEAEIERLELLLQELVNLSRLESHMIEIRPEQESIKQTITQAVDIVILKAVQKHIELQVNLDNDVVVCHDPKWTVEAIANVLDNAIKYSKENTQVVVGANTLPNLFILEVEDEGIGIPAEELHEIYKRFYRGRTAGKFAKDGAGIGLYLSRKIIEQQGGTIVAKRRPQGGTVFRITLPL